MVARACDAAIKAIGAYGNGFYHPVRRHSARGYQSPIAFVAIRQKNLTRLSTHLRASPAVAAVFFAVILLTLRDACPLIFTLLPTFPGSFLCMRSCPPVKKITVNGTNK